MFCDQCRAIWFASLGDFTFWLSPWLSLLAEPKSINQSNFIIKCDKRTQNSAEFSENDSEENIIKNT